MGAFVPGQRARGIRMLACALALPLLACTNAPAQDQKPTKNEPRKDAPRKDAAPPETTPADDELQELKDDLLTGAESVAVPAAARLFVGVAGEAAGKHDAWLRDHVLNAQESRPEARVHLLEAIFNNWLVRPDAAARLARASILDPEQVVRDAAGKALAHIEKPAAYEQLFDALTEATKRPVAERAQSIDAVVSVVERKANPKEATSILVRGLTLVDGPDEARLHKALNGLTGHKFATDKAWGAWYEAHKADTQVEWLRETIKQLEAERDRANAASERLFARLVDLSPSPEARLDVLREGVGKDSMPAIRLRAIRELGGSTFRRNEKAFDLLMQVIDGAANDQDESALKEALVALGATEDPRGLVVIVKYVASGSRDVRLRAVQGLGNLRAPAAVPTLLGLLADGKLETNDPEGAACVANALGRIGRDADGKASAALVAMIERLRADPSSGGGNGARSALLQAACVGLGGLSSSLAPNDSASKTVAASLAQLADQKSDDDVRREATLALGTVPCDDALRAVCARLAKADESGKVKKAALTALGLQAQRDGLPDGAFGEIVDQLAGALGGVDDTLKNESWSELKKLVASERRQLDALESLVAALKKRGSVEPARSLLEQLPPLKGADVPAPRAVRIAGLVLERCVLRVRENPKSVLAELADLHDLPAVAADQRLARRMAVVQAMALHSSGEMRRATDILVPLIAQDAKDADAWRVLLDAWLELSNKGDRAIVKDQFASLHKAVEGAAPEVQARVTETIQKIDEAPAKAPEQRPGG